MLKISIIIFFIFAFGSKCTFAQSENSCFLGDSTKFYWQNRKLSFSDFALIRKNNEREKLAISATCIEFTFRTRNDSTFFMTRAAFSKEKSWRNFENFCNYHLNHEQRHFDITEYFCRSFYQKVKNNELNELEISKIYQEIANSCDSLQNQYDNETKNGTNFSMQEFWDQKIEKLLENYSALSLKAEIFIKKPFCKICW